MADQNRTARLMHLAQAEFEKHRTKPTRQRFRALNVRPSKYDESWDRQRGGAARLMATVLTADDVQLYQRVSADDKTVESYAAAAEWFAREADYLRRIARLLETAAGRLNIVTARHAASKGGVHHEG